MKRVISILLILVLLVGGVSSVSAQNTTNESTLTVPETEDPVEEEPENTTYVGQIDNSLRIVDYELVDSEMVVTLESDIPRRITVVDLGAASSSDGVSEFSFKSQQIPRGTTTVRLPVTVDDGQAGVGITAGTNGVVITTGSDTSIFKGETGWREVQIGFLSGLVIVSLATVSTGYLKIKNTSDDPERIL